ncbi:MAG: hypothetical protein AAF843_19970 [Bacteroidota bacterium]
MRFYVCIVTLLFACITDKNNNYATSEPTGELALAIKQEIQAISNASQLQQYLEKIHACDQLYRTEEKRILSDFGHDSPEYDQIWEIITQIDLDNYFRIQAVLDEFGYPEIDSVGETAAATPWLIIHHSPFYEHRVSNFNVLFNAYQKGDLGKNAFDLFLTRMYSMKYHKSFRMPSPYKIEAKIDSLIQILELEKLVTN